MALSISAVLPSGERLPLLVGDISWTGQQVKTALSQHLEGSRYVSALLHKDRVIGNDQTLEKAGVGADGNVEPGSVDLGIVVSELLNLADLAELPGMSTEYKYNNWSGAEIYPGEEDEVRQIAAKTECYFLKRKVSEEDKARLAETARLQEETRRPEEDAREEEEEEEQGEEQEEDEAAAKDADVTVAMPQEWMDFYDDYASKHEGKAPGMRANIFGTGIIQKMQNVVDRELKTALAKSYEGFDRLEFSVRNNIGATAKYNLIDARSSEPIRFADHKTGLYALLVGSATFGREEMRIGIRSAYLSSERFCGVHRPFYM